MSNNQIKVGNLGVEVKLKESLIRPIGNQQQLFSQNPGEMLPVIQLVSETGCDLQKEISDAIKVNAPLLSTVPVEDVRDDFMAIIGGRSAGKALKMLASLGLMDTILGKETLSKMGGREVKDFNTLTDEIERTKQTTVRRLGLFYLCFKKKYAIQSIERLQYDEETTQHLRDAIALMEKIYFMARPEELMDFMSRYGRERYDYLHNLAKAQRIVYGFPETKIMNRHHMLETIESTGHPIYIEDLAVTEEDLIEEGILKEGDDARKLLLMLTDVVHRSKKANNRENLLRCAKKFNRNKFAAATRNVKWMK